jgi:hypothetical protein
VDGNAIAAPADRGGTFGADAGATAGVGLTREVAGDAEALA